MVLPTPTTQAAGEARLALSTAEIDQLVRAARVLISPLEHESVDAWRSAVNREVKQLVHGDTAGFLLPVSDGLMMYSDEHNPDELARYQDYPPPPLVDGTPLWQRMVEVEVGTLATIYGNRYDVYLNSTYYQEYAGANRAHDTLASAVSLGGVDARGMACLHVWHERPDGRLFGDREVALLRLLHPALEAGAQVQMQWGQHRNELLSMIDALGQAILVCDVASGRPVHETPALSDILAADPEGARVREHMLRAASGTGSGELATTSARYAVRCTLYGNHLPTASRMILVALERRTPRLRSESDLNAAFGLTRAEARVAQLIAQGRGNADIAQLLIISPHTARRHTERVLLKLRVHSRAEVAAKLFE